MGDIYWQALLLILDGFSTMPMCIMTSRTQKWLDENAMPRGKQGDINDAIGKLCSAGLVDALSFESLHPSADRSIYTSTQCPTKLEFFHYRLTKKGECEQIALLNYFRALRGFGMYMRNTALNVQLTRYSGER